MEQEKIGSDKIILLERVVLEHFIHKTIKLEENEKVGS